MTSSRTSSQCRDHRSARDCGSVRGPRRHYRIGTISSVSTAPTLIPPPHESKSFTLASEFPVFASCEARRVVGLRIPSLIGLTSLLFRVRGYAQPVGAGPIRGPALIPREVCWPRTHAPSLSPKVRICSHSTVRRCDRPWRLPSFAAVARVVEVLAGGPIRGDLQAHLAVAPPGPAVTERRRPRCCCRDEWPWRVRRPSAPAFTDDQAQSEGPCNNGIVARAFRRRRRRRRGPPPSCRTDR